MVKKIQKYKQIYFAPVSRFGYMIDGVNKFIISSFNFNLKNSNYENNFR